MASGSAGPSARSEPRTTRGRRSPRASPARSICALRRLLPVHVQFHRPRKRTQHPEIETPFLAAQVWRETRRLERRARIGGRGSISGAGKHDMPPSQEVFEGPRGKGRMPARIPNHASPGKEPRQDLPVPVARGDPEVPVSPPWRKKGWTVPAKAVLEATRHGGRVRRPLRPPRSRTARLAPCGARRMPETTIAARFRPGDVEAVVAGLEPIGRSALRCTEAEGWDRCQSGIRSQAWSRGTRFGHNGTATCAGLFTTSVHPPLEPSERWRGSVSQTGRRRPGASGGRMSRPRSSATLSRAEKGRGLGRSTGAHSAVRRVDGRSPGCSRALSRRHCFDRLLGRGRPMPEYRRMSRGLLVPPAQQHPLLPLAGSEREAEEEAAPVIGKWVRARSDWFWFARPWRARHGPPFVFDVTAPSFLARERGLGLGRGRCSRREDDWRNRPEWN